MVIHTQAQTYQWSLTNSPVPSFFLKMFVFLNVDTGFAVHYDDVSFGCDSSYIVKTVDGGTIWIGVPNFLVLDSAVVCGLRGINNTIIYGVGGYDSHTG